MRHEVTIISDDCRLEVGNKISLSGIYDEAIVFRSLPARVLKLCLYQRWSDFPTPEIVTIIVRGAPIGDLELRGEAKPSAPPKAGLQARIMAAFGPIDFISDGTLSFGTLLGNDQEPIYVHKLSVRIDPNLKID